MTNLPAIRESLLHRFVDESIAYEKTGAPIPQPLLLYAAAGGAAMLVASISIQIWPSPEAISESGFFLIAKEALAGFVAFLKLLALPIALAGAAALGVTGYLALNPRQRIGWHYACVGEFVGGVGTLGMSALVLLAIILTALLWLLIISIALAILGAILGGLGE